MAATQPDFEVAVIGTGFSGLGAAIKLKQAGRSFAVFEKEADVGGTWLVNSYPGCACDVPSHLYSYSFAPNPDWSRTYSPQAEIWDYLRRCADEAGVRGQIRFKTEVTRLDYDDAARLWRVHTADGQSTTARSVIGGFGGLSRAAFPDIPGQDRFAGPSFHSQQWDHDVDLAGKTVAVIGTGASAIQFVPEIAKTAGKVLMFQRTAPWVLPKLDRDFTAFEKWLFRHVPVTQKLMRGGIYVACEIFGAAFSGNSLLMRTLQRIANRHINRHIPDPELRETLTPRFRMGCKRVLFSNEYYPAVARDNVEVISTPIREISAQGVVTEEGTEHCADVIVYGTGFHATALLPRGVIRGRDGLDIVDRWETTGMESYLGTTVSGFPNLFIIPGPNTGTGSTSVVYMIESQLRYVMDALDQMDRDGLATVEVRREVEQAFNAKLQAKMADTVWQKGGCHSWYQDASGRNVALWPAPTWHFRRATAHFKLADYTVSRLADRTAQPETPTAQAA